MPAMVWREATSEKGVQFQEQGKHTMNGVIVVDKPPGKTSFDVVRDVKKALGTKKIGHTGTLDPLATGVLPLCINEATKLVQFLATDDKEYRATMVCGITTDTQDITGTITGRSEVHLTRNDVEAVIKEFTGTVAQKVPRYSACKYRGKPYYKWTREGLLLETPVRNVWVHDIVLEEIVCPAVTMRISCSKGTYIRTLCADMGDRLGCGATLSELRRIRSGRFSERDALSLDHAGDKEKARLISEHIIPISEALDDFTTISVCREVAEKIRDGYQPEIETFSKLCVPPVNKGAMVKIVTEYNQLVAVAEMLLSSEELPQAHEKGQAVKLMRVFNC